MDLLHRVADWSTGNFACCKLNIKYGSNQCMYLSDAYQCYCIACCKETYRGSSAKLAWESRGSEWMLWLYTMAAA